MVTAPPAPGHTTTVTLSRPPLLHEVRLPLCPRHPHGPKSRRISAPFAGGLTTPRSHRHESLGAAPVSPVCGEVVLRGDECVSLGWCFWHRSCYGCLMCGDRRIVQGVKVDDLFSSEEAPDRGGEAEYGSLGRVKSREVNDVPLCVKCVKEISEEKLDEEHLIPMALGRVDRFDGGLSRRRWEARQEAEPRATAIPSHMFEETTNDAARPSSPIYVATQNTMSTASSKRSSTNSIPKWMQYLPSQRQPSQDCSEPRPASILDQHFSPDASSAAISDEDAESDAPPPPPVPPHTIPLRSRSSVSTYLPVQMLRPFTLINEEPVQRPSSAKAAVGRATPGKQVHFTNTPHFNSSMATQSVGERTELPSEAAEYLERYRLRSPLDLRSSAVHVPTRLDGRVTAFGLPFTKCVTPYYGPTCARPHGSTSAASAASGIREDSGSSSHKDDIIRGYEGYSQSPGSSAQDGDGYVEGPDGRRRSSTFQDQLKTVFGFH